MENLFVRYEKFGFNTKNCLIGEIKGLADEVKRSGNLSAKCSNPESSIRLLNRKRFLGSRARHYLLAYAMLRGENYNNLEKNCRQDNKPNPELILDIIRLHLSKYDRDNSGWTLGKVKQWLAGELK